MFQVILDVPVVLVMVPLIAIQRLATLQCDGWRPGKRLTSKIINIHLSSTYHPLIIHLFSRFIENHMISHVQKLELHDVLFHTTET